MDSRDIRRTWSLAELNANSCNDIIGTQSNYRSALVSSLVSLGQQRTQVDT